MRTVGSYIRIFTASYSIRKIKEVGVVKNTGGNKCLSMLKTL